MSTALVTLPLPTLRDYVTWFRRRSGGRLGGRPRAIDVNPDLVHVVAAELAQGKSPRSAGKAAGYGQQVGEQVRDEHGDLVRALRDEIERACAENVLVRIAEATAARMADACDQGSKTGAQSYRVALEAVGVIGSKGVSIHVGDTYVQTVAITPDELAPEQRAAYERARAAFRRR